MWARLMDDVLRRGGAAEHLAVDGTAPPPSPGSVGYSPDIPPHEAGFAGTPVAGESYP
jgi:hypothetical protein